MSHRRALSTRQRPARVPRGIAIPGAIASVRRLAASLGPDGDPS